MQSTKTAAVTNGKPASEVKTPPYLLYGLLIGGILAARVFDLATQSTEWSVQIYQSVAWNRSLLVLAIISSSLVAFYLKERLPPLLAWLSCGVVGGISMMLVNSIPGAAIGLTIGAAVLATGPCVSIVTFFGRSIVPSMLLGFSTGAAAALSWLRFGAPGGEVTEILSILAPLLTGLLATTLTLRFIPSNRRWYGWIGATALFASFGCFGLVWTVITNIESTRNSIPTVIASSHGSDNLLRSFYPSVTRKQLKTCRSIDKLLSRNDLPYPGRFFVSLHFDKKSSTADIAKASRLPFVTGATVTEGCEITDEQFAKLNLRCANWLNFEPGTKLTANALRNVSFSNVQSLSVEGEQFGDDLIPLIQGTPNWFTLNLRGTRVTAEGLRDLNAKVCSIDLSDTPVDDDVFAALSNLTQLQWLNLSGTNITGQGIEQLPRSIKRLDLSNTQFDSDHLAKFVTPEGAEPTPWNTFYLSELSIRRTPFKRESTKKLLEVANTLGSLNVSGLDQLPFEFFQQVKTPHVGLDAKTLTPKNIHLVKPVPLDVHYDATTIPAADILKDFVALEKARAEFFATQPRIAADPITSLVVENLQLTRESLGVFGRERSLPNELEVRFIDARIRNRRVPMLWNVRNARSTFPELKGYEESDD